MKKTLIVFLSIILSVNAFGLELITDSNVKYKRGIYRNFEEFKFNNPTLDLRYVISVNTESFGFLGTGDKCTYYTLDVGKEESKTIGTVYGFCDGKSIYINSIETDKLHKAKFALLQNVGLYSYFEHIVENYSGGMAYGVGGAGGMMMAGGGKTYSLGRSILDINNGDKIVFNKSCLKEILKDDKALYDVFMALEWKGDYLYQYLMKYNIKHHDDKIVNREMELSKDEANNYLLITENDSTDELYYNRIIKKFKYNTAFNSVYIENLSYSNKNKKQIGLVAKSRFYTFNYDNEFAPCRVGLWKFYTKTGKLKQELIYDIIGHNIYKRDFDENGEIVNAKYINN